tara:strand:+ start:121 stop:579 length:459 start_codon:yes stop_codon:yes gene_type:complete
MKALLTITFLATLNFSFYSQITDTCEYVSENYDLGGLDCAWGVYTSNFPIDSYQWVNCDDMYSPFVGDTSEYYGSSYTGNVAVIIEAWGCIDTSFCQDICTYGIEDNEENPSSKKELTKIIDLTGRESKDQPNRVLIYVYSDGTTEKRFRVE